MKKQQGFTLIELMIVVAIIGILAAIALPAYQDYTKRAKVSEGLSLASSAKVAVSEYFFSENKWPTKNVSAGIPEDIKTGIVNNIQVETSGAIRITYTNEVVSGGEITLTPNNASGAISWTCKFDDTTDMTAQLVPSNCR